MAHPNTTPAHDGQPQHLRAIGPTLSQWDAVNVRAILERRRGTAETTPGERRLMDRPLEVVRDADAWIDGDVCAVFPVAIDWNPQRWLLHSGPGRARRVAPNPALFPSSEAWTAQTRDSVLLAVQSAATRARLRRREIQQRVSERLSATFAAWSRTHHADFLPRFLVATLLVLAGWTPVPSGWEAPVETAPPRAWGPFRIVADGDPEPPAMMRWAVDQLRSGRGWMHGVAHVPAPWHPDCCSVWWPPCGSGTAGR